MRKSLLKLNERHLPKALRQALVLITLLLLPSAAWGQDYYNLLVGGERVSSLNATNITGNNITGTVSYSSTNNTLTLNGATINGCIRYSGTTELKINLEGDNIITATDSAAIRTTYVTESAPDNAILTLNGTGTLKLTPGSAPSIQYFNSVTLSGCNAYSTDDYNNHITSTGGYLGDASKTVIICSGMPYGFYVGGKIVTSNNKGSVLGSSMDFSPATTDVATLYLNKATVTGDIEWDMNNALTIQLTEGNTIDGRIYSKKDVALSFTYPSGSNNSYLTLGKSTNTESAISGFTEVTLMEGLKYEENASYNTSDEALKIKNGDANIPLAHISYHYGLTIADVAVTSANAENITNDNTVSFSASTNTLTLNGATITGDIIKQSSADNKSLIVNLVGSNTLHGAISFNEDNPGDLTFTGKGSLTITNEESIFNSSVNSVNADGLYVATDNPNLYDASSATISTTEAYPIWVYNTSTQKYTQLTATASTYTTPEADVDENHKGSVSYSADTLTLDNFFCKTTENSAYVFQIGGSLTNLTVNLKGTNETSHYCFNYLKPTDGDDLQLTYTTSNNGSLEFDSDPNEWYMNFAYDKGLGYYPWKISTDWPRLMIGSTPVRGTGSVDGYSNISYNDESKTLTLSGATIGDVSSTNTDISVYLDDLTVEISGTNTIYGRFWGQYSENGSYAGKINFKNADFANASLIISGIGDGQGPITEFSECKLDEKIKITEAKKVDGTSVNVDVLTYANGNYVDGSGNVLAEITLSYQAPQLTVAGIEPDENGVISGDGISSGTVTFTPADDTVSPAQPATLTLEGATIDGYISSSIESLTVYLKGSSTINAGTGISPFQYFKATESSPSTGSLTFNSSDEDKGELTMNGIHESANISSGYSTSPTFTSYSTATGYEGWIKKEYYYNDEPGNQNVVIYKNINYDLWIGGTRITKDNVCPHSGGPTYDIENERLSVSGSCNYSIESSMDNLVIMLSDNAIINGSISTHEGATGELTFIGNDEPEQTTKMFSINNGDEAAISGFSDITYEGFIILSDGAKYDKDEKKLVDASGSAMTRATFASSVELTKPSLTTSQDESVVTVTLSNDNKTTIKPNSEDQTTFYDITYGTLKYSIDYVDGSTGVTDATYDSDNKPTMSKPGTLTAYVYLNGETSETSTGKYFGAKQEVFTVAIGDKIEGTSWFTPEIKADDQIESEFMTQEDESGIFEREGEGSELYLVAKKSGTTTVNASLWCEEGLTVLNSNIALTFNVGESLSSVFEGENTYGAIYSETAIQVPEGMTAYVITGIDEETGSVKTSDPLDFIPAKTAVLLEKGTDAIAMTHVPYTGTATAPTNNKLNYSDPNSPAKPSTTDNWYVLYNNKFVKVTTNTEVKGGKCYLNLNGIAAGTRGFYNIGNGEGTTAIREVKNGEVNSEKWGNGEWFDLQGRRLSAKPNKSGLYILNGKKIVIK